jgi:LAS superfamily LD-carboxypeptidase LdcB
VRRSAKKNEARRPRQPPGPVAQQPDREVAPATGHATGHTTGPAALSPAQVLALQRTVGNLGVQALLAQHEPAAGARVHEADRPTVSREETAPSADAPAEVPLTKKEIASFFDRQFETAFKDKGLAKYFSLALGPVKKTKKPPKGAPIETTVQACWEALETALKGMTGDTRGFAKTIALQVTEGATPEYMPLKVALSRRNVTAGEEAGIEATLSEVESAYAFGGKAGLRVEKSAYAAYIKLYQAAEAAGLMKEIPDLFKIVSDYRSVSEQKGLWDAKVAAVAKSHPDWSEKQVEDEARRWVAKPGGSAHHTGYAVDLHMGWSISSANAKEMQDKKSKLYEKYGKYWEWIKENGPKHGFLPYAAEPWHWEAWLA